MREVLFRGKRISIGEYERGDIWVYGAYLSATGHWHKYGKHKEWIVTNSIQNGGYFNVIGRFAVKSETIGQYTGLDDKHGNKVFEGDIVRYQVDNDDCPFPDKDTKPRVGRVFFSDHRASFSLAMGLNGSDSLNNDLFRYIRGGNRVEVIGNIHDNPELLEEKEE